MRDGSAHPETIVLVATRAKIERLKMAMRKLRAALRDVEQDWSEAEVVGEAEGEKVADVAAMMRDLEEAAQKRSRS